MTTAAARRRRNSPWWKLNPQVTAGESPHDDGGARRSSVRNVTVADGWERRVNARITAMTASSNFKLILLRHGQSDWNEKNLFTGWVDVPLTEQGRAEAKRGGELLVDTKRKKRGAALRCILPLRPGQP